MNNKLLINERQSNLGNFMVGRLLPFKKKRQVGPFTFIDHMGPSEIGNGNYLDVDQHPHIGLSTLTYLFKGEIEHRDSTGSIQIISPGDVGFMTAGKGVTHTERTPKNKRNGEVFTMHGYQIWVVIPKQLSEMDPEFTFIPKTNIPVLTQNDLTIKVVAGEAFSVKSPLTGLSPLFMVDIKANNETTLDLKNKIKGEVAFVIVNGSVKIGDDCVEEGQMLISNTNEQCEICLTKNTQILLFGGEPLDQEYYLSWNFVSNSKERLKKAKEDWDNKLFPKVPGDETYIPFPILKKN